MMMAQACGYKAGDFIHTFGDAHIYNNHMEQVNPEVKNIFDFKFDDFTLVDYNPHPHIKGVVAI